MRLDRRAQPSFRFLVIDAFASVKFVQPGAHLGAERRIFVERGPEKVGQNHLRLAVRFRSQLDDTAFEFGRELQRHCVFVNDYV
jgi:hypothetical protein